MTNKVSRPKTVLLVEDDEDDQFFFIEALSAIENAALYDVVNNGKEAMDRLEGSVIHPDFIFMDVHMPVMNGIECLTAITKNAGLREIPVVILSTVTGIGDLVCKLGAKAFMKKANTGTKLRIQLEEMINLEFIPAGNEAGQTSNRAFIN